jgi:uncharacterized membrane-anchored protein
MDDIMVKNSKKLSIMFHLVAMLSFIGGLFVIKQNCVVGLVILAISGVLGGLVLD